jgi:AraC-like DNA-binding protein
MALRAEDPEARVGWYGGLDPRDRGRLAVRLGLVECDPAVPENAAEATRLQRAGWTVNDIASEFGCSRRTVQRYLRKAS